MDSTTTKRMNHFRLLVVCSIILCFPMKVEAQDAIPDTLQQPDQANYIYFKSSVDQKVHQIFLGTIRGASLGGAIATLTDFSSNQQGSNYGPPAVVGGSILGGLCL